MTALLNNQTLSTFFLANVGQLTFGQKNARVSQARAMLSFNILQTFLKVKVVQIYGDVLYLRHALINDV